MIRLTLLRKSECVLFEKVSNGFSEEFSNRFLKWVILHPNSDYLTYYVYKFGQVIMSMNMTFHIGIMVININSVYRNIVRIKCNNI